MLVYEYVERGSLDSWLLTSLDIKSSTTMSTSADTIANCSIVSVETASGKVEFGELSKEVRDFTLGPFLVMLVGSVIGWQMFFLGGAGIIFLASSLLSYIFAPLSILDVIFIHDSFSVLKAAAMLLSICGFVSYIYGGYLDFKAGKSAVEPATKEDV
ncbi:hypothetical protein L7F22_022000 [Adiantum nelumboides]|nr:hypothetical protein [Adiantum nelumboides]